MHQPPPQPLVLLRDNRKSGVIFQGTRVLPSYRSISSPVERDPRKEGLCIEILYWSLINTIYSYLPNTTRQRSRWATLFSPLGTCFCFHQGWINHSICAQVLHGTEPNLKSDMWTARISDDINDMRDRQQHHTSISTSMEHPKWQPWPCSCPAAHSHSSGTLLPGASTHVPTDIQVSWCGKSHRLKLVLKNNLGSF